MLGAERFIHDLYSNGAQTIASSEINQKRQKCEKPFLSFHPYFLKQNIVFTTST
ncbi:hypothetical protein D920_03010 [Enterococcus faecalis 13-SD-W-01]|nr:hypothetical protein D920_03010 [Enterococcus faecalis 13-SD-W-01]